jgi:hypothetical protein
VVPSEGKDHETSHLRLGVAVGAFLGGFLGFAEEKDDEPPSRGSRLSLQGGPGLAGLALQIRY